MNIQTVNSSKVVLVTGASSGIGKAIASKMDITKASAFVQRYC